jgi:DNA repair protein RadC
MSARKGDRIAPCWVRLVREPGAPPFGRVTINGPGDVARLVERRFARAIQESVVVLALDPAHRVLAACEVARGGLDACAVDNRVVLTAALAAGASAVLLVHNHTSGRVEPSTADRRVTIDLGRACELVGLEFVDHVILGGRGRWYSMDAGRAGRG